MKTDLESIIELLAGRDDLDDLRASLLDPGSDASQFLEANRRKTKGLLDPSTRIASWPDPLGGQPTRAGSAHRVASLGLIAGVGGVFLVAGYLLAKETTDPNALALEQSVNDTRKVVERMEKRLDDAPQMPPMIPVDPAGTRDEIRRLRETIEAMKSRVDDLSIAAKQRVEAAANGQDVPNRPPAGNVPDPITPNPAIASIAAEISTVRREIAAKEQAQARQIGEIRTVLEEVNSVVRRVLSRPNGSTAGNEALVALVQSLIQNLSHSNANVRLEAVEQLVRLGPLGRACLPTLRQQINRESDPNVRSAIETALTVFGPN